MSDSGEHWRVPTPGAVLEQLADLLGIPHEAIPPRVGPLPLFLTSRETAAVLRTEHRTILDSCRRGTLPAIKVGGEWRISNLYILAAAVGIRLPGSTPHNPIKSDK